jgi:uncharacterized protein YhaN
MKILKLDLKAVGPFTDQCLDLSAGNYGLHVILGPNEAGKSSALRALRALFYGFSHQTSDNFVHNNKLLRVGATLRHSNGSEISFLRRKAAAGTLLNQDGNTLPDAVLDPYLGRVDRQQFTTFFGIGHEDLREGNEQLLQAGGKLAESLFAAGAGGARLGQLLIKYEARADELYKKGGRNQFIPSALDRYKKKLEVLQNCALVEDWSKHEALAGKARSERETTRQQLEQLQVEHARLERFKKIVPLLSTRRAILIELTEMGELPELPADFSQSRVAAITALQNAQAASAELTDQIQQIESRLVNVVIPDALLLQAPAIEALQGQLGIYRKARQQIPVLTSKLNTLQKDAEAIVREVRPELPFERVEELRITVARRQQLQSFSREIVRLRQEQNQAARSLDELNDETKATEAAIATQPAARDSRALVDTLATIQQSGNLEKQLAEESIKFEKTTRQAQTDLKKLGLWSGDLQELETLAVPPDESIELARGRGEKAAAELEAARNQLHDLEAELGGVNREIAALLASGQIPTEADLRSARAQRQRGWELVRDGWLGGSARNSEVDAYTNGLKLDAAYEQAVVHADDIADRMRSESDRVVKQASLAAQRQEMDDALHRARERMVRAEKALSAVEKDWGALWSPIGMVPRSPKEMTSWVVRQRAIAEQVRFIREQADHLNRLKHQIEQHRLLVAGALSQVNESASDLDSLAGLMARAVSVVDQIRRESARRESLRETLSQSEAKLEKLHRQRAAIQTEQAELRQQWKTAAADFGAPDDADPAVVLAVVERIDALFAKMADLNQTATDLTACNRQVESIAKQAADLVESVANDLKDAGTEPVIVALNDRLNKARTDQTLREQLILQRQQAVQGLNQATQQEMRAREAIESLCRLARCEVAADLPAAIARDEKYKTIRAQLHQLDQQLLLVSNGQTIEQLEQQATAIDLDSLPTLLAELPGKIAVLSEQRSQLDQTIGSEESALRQWDGNGSAGEAAEQAQQLLAELRDAASEFARLKLAAAVLHSGIERYRKRKQGPLLARASQLFSVSTLGAFASLQAEYRENDSPKLIGVRQNGNPVEIDEMSDGSRDQLYLALRLATLEDYLTSIEPIPFVVDDILVHFDNDRATATLKVLAELSRRTQVILFTHHAHVADLAMGIGGDVHVSRLSRP